MIRTVLTAAMTIAVTFATAQVASAQSSSAGSSETMRGLLQDGFEIKAAAPNGNTFVVFMQKGNSAYACEFTTVTNTRCGAINREAE